MKINNKYNHIKKEILKISKYLFIHSIEFFRSDSFERTEKGSF